METTELIQHLNRSCELQLAEHLSIDQLETLLAEKVNHLIQIDFNALLQLLYRVDVSESKLKQLLKRDNETGPGEDAGRIIARLIIERQWQKIETRRRFSSGDGGNLGSGNPAGGDDGGNGGNDGNDGDERW